MPGGGRVGYHPVQPRSVARRRDRATARALPRQSKLRRLPAMKTHAVKASEIQRSWFIVDADDQVLGRFASQVAQILRGKHKPIYSPHLDTGDFVVIVNAEKIRFTGQKETDKHYY